MTPSNTERATTSTPEQSGIRLRTRLVAHGQQEAFDSNPGESTNHGTRNGSVTGETTSPPDSFAVGDQAEEEWEQPFSENKRQADELLNELDAGLQDSLDAKSTGILVIKEKQAYNKPLDSAIKFDGTNYVSWYICVSDGLKSMNLWKVVHAREDQIPTAGEQLELYYLALVKARLYLRQSLEPKLIPVYQQYSHPRELLKALKNCYNASSDMQRSNLLRKFRSLRLDKYENTMTFLSEVWCAYIELLNCGYKMNFAELKSHLLIELGQFWHYYMSTLKTVKSWEELTATVQEEMTRFRSTLGNGGKGQGPSNVAFFTFQANGQGNQHGKKREREERKCHHCKKRGHLIKDCKIKKRKEAIARKKAAEKVNHENIKEQAALVQDSIKDAYVKASIPDEENDIGYYGFMAICSRVYGEKTNVWMADSGATSHMCCQQNWFYGWNEICHDTSVTVASGEDMVLEKLCCDTGMTL